MSIRRIGVRSTTVGLGVLASMALMAAPSWAAAGGNSANAALCEPGGYPGVLLAQDGSAFKNAGKCTSYAAKGGQLVGLAAVAGAVSGGEFPLTCSGFGLEPGGYAMCEVLYKSGFGEGVSGNIAADGTFSISRTLPCEFNGSKTASLVVRALTPIFTLRFEREFPPPSGC